MGFESEGRMAPQHADQGLWIRTPMVRTTTTRSRAVPKPESKANVELGGRARLAHPGHSFSTRRNQCGHHGLGRFGDSRQLVGMKWVRRLGQVAPRGGADGVDKAGVGVGDHQDGAAEPPAHQED
jgi:hypothetical protein